MLASAHVAAAVWGIRRFAVGMTGPVMFLSDAAWSPPLPHWFLAAAFSAGVAATGAYLARVGPGPPPWGDRRSGAGAAVQDPGPGGAGGARSGRAAPTRAAGRAQAGGGDAAPPRASTWSRTWRLRRARIAPMPRRRSEEMTSASPIRV